MTTVYDTGVLIAVDRNDRNDRNVWADHRVGTLLAKSDATRPRHSCGSQGSPWTQMSYGTTTHNPANSQFVVFAAAVDHARNILDTDTFDICAGTGAAMTLTETGLFPTLTDGSADHIGAARVRLSAPATDRADRDDLRRWSCEIPQHPDAKAQSLC